MMSMCCARRHAAGVRRGVRAVDVGDLRARVHLRPRQRARRRAPPASGGAGAAGAAAGGIEQRAFLDIDSLLRPVYGTASRAPRSGMPRSPAGRCWRRGLSPQITTISTATAPPVIAEARLRSGRAGSGRAAARQVKQAITTAKVRGRHDHAARRLAFGTKK